jgi:hypothetical protein
MSRMTNTGLPVPADPALGPSIQSGWLVFAGLIVLWAGLWNICQGALAFFRSDLFAHHSVGGPLWVWSILLILFGVLQVVASGAIMSHRSWGRWFGIVTVGLAMSVNLLTIGTSGWWSTALIPVEILALFGLTVKWRSPQRATV